MENQCEATVIHSDSRCKYYNNNHYSRTKGDSDFE